MFHLHFRLWSSFLSLQILCFWLRNLWFSLLRHKSRIPKSFRSLWDLHSDYSWLLSLLSCSRRDYLQSMSWELREIRGDLLWFQCRTYPWWKWCLLCLFSRMQNLCRNWRELNLHRMWSRKWIHHLALPPSSIQLLLFTHAFTNNSYTPLNVLYSDQLYFLYWW